MQWWRTGSMMQGTTTGCYLCSVWTSPEVRAIFFTPKKKRVLFLLQISLHFLPLTEPFVTSLFVQLRKWRPEGRNAEKVWALSASCWALPRVPLHSALHGENMLLLSTLIFYSHTTQKWAGKKNTRQPNYLLSDRELREKYLLCG